MSLHHYQFSYVLLALTLFLCNSVNAKPVIGWVEPVTIDEAFIKVMAKIDTGADVTSIDARIIKTYREDDDDWVHFEISNKTGQAVELKKKVDRYLPIKRKLMEPEMRPVIHLGVCVGNIYRNIEVNLAQRKNFEYRMLIGRNFLDTTYVVDSELKKTTTPSCTQIKMPDHD